jgi:sialidase-1
MKGGLTRLPVKDRDVLIFSNADTGGGDRKRMTVWASFDGGMTWPVKRLVYESFSAYSSLVAGRPGTPAAGRIFLLFEGGPKGRYSAMQVARFNLSWILQGERTGDGEVPQWVLN